MANWSFGVNNGFRAATRAPGKEQSQPAKIPRGSAIASESPPHRKSRERGGANGFQSLSDDENNEAIGDDGTARTRIVRGRRRWRAEFRRHRVDVVRLGIERHGAGPLLRGTFSATVN